MYFSPPAIVCVVHEHPLPPLLGEVSLGDDGDAGGESLSDGAVGFGLFEWVGGVYWPQMIFLAVGMGIVCQSCIAYVVQEAGPLSFGLVMCACPAGSSVLGKLLGQAPMPGPRTLIGGAITLVGLATVLIGTDARTRGAEGQQRVMLTPALSSGRGGAAFHLSPATFSASPSGSTAAQFLVLDAGTGGGMHQQGGQDLEYQHFPVNVVPGRG